MKLIEKLRQLLEYSANDEFDLTKTNKLDSGFHKFLVDANIKYPDEVRFIADSKHRVFVAWSADSLMHDQVMKKLKLKKGSELYSDLDYAVTGKATYDKSKRKWVVDETEFLDVYPKGVQEKWKTLNWGFTKSSGLEFESWIRSFKPSSAYDDEEEFWDKQEESLRVGPNTVNRISPLTKTKLKPTEFDRGLYKCPLCNQKFSFADMMYIKSKNQCPKCKGKLKI